MATISAEEKKEKLARARAKLKKHRDVQATATDSRPSSVGAPSPTFSDKASLAPVTDAVSPPPPKHAKLASEVPTSLFGSSGTDHDAFFSAPPSDTIPEAVAEVEEPVAPPPPKKKVEPIAPAPAVDSEPAPAPAAESATSTPRKPAAHEQTIKLLVSEKAQLASQLDALQAQLDERDAAASKAQESAAEHITKLKDLESQLSVEQSRIGEVEKTRTDLQERLSVLEREAALAQKSASELQSSLDERDRAIVSLKAELAADTKVSDLEGRLKAKTSHADSLESEISRLRNAQNALKSDKDAADGRIKELQEQSTTAGEAHQELQRGHTALQVELDSARDALKQAQSASDATTTELETLKRSSLNSQSDLDDAKRELENLQASLAVAQESLTSAEGRAAQAVSRRDGLQSDNDSLLAQVNELREKTVALTDELVAAKDKHDAVHRSLRERDGDLSKSQTAQEAASARVTALEQQLAEREQQLTKAKEQAERAEHDVQYAQDEAGSREKEISHLKEKLTKADGELARYRTGAEARVAELHELQSQLETSKSDAEAERKEREKLQADLAQMQESSLGLQSQIEELRQKQVSPEGSRAPSVHAPLNGNSGVNSVDMSPAPSISPARSLRPLSPNGVPSRSASPVEQAHADGKQQDAALQLSNLHSQIRTLEDRAFGEQSRATGLQRDVGVLESRVAELERQVAFEKERADRAMREVFEAGASNSLSPLATPTRNIDVDRDLLTPTKIGPPTPVSLSSSRGSFRGSHRRAQTEAYLPSGSVSARSDFPFPSSHSVSRPPPPPKRASHARRVSLNLLKSRMEHELGLPDISLAAPTPHIAIDEHTEEGRFSGEHRHHQRPRAQLGDEIIFAACCQGDILII